MQIEAKIAPIFILILIVPLVSYGQPELGSLQIDLTEVTGERADYHGTALKIYQDNTNIPFKTIDSLSANPYKISLPLGHLYKVEVYVNSMYACVGYVNLENNNEKLELGIPLPGSVRFTVLYNDGYTPINNATVMVKSNDRTYEYWTNSTTDDAGNTVRFWLQPTIVNDNYYVATVLLGNDLSYSYLTNILPGVSGNIQIVTPWPVVEPPFVVSVYKSTLQKISKADGNFVVDLFDSNGNKITQSKVDATGEAFFSNLKLGSYVFDAILLNDDKNRVWGTAKMLVDGKLASIQILKNQTDDNNGDLIYANQKHGGTTDTSQNQRQLIISPLKQLKSGILPEDVKCNSNLVLVLKGYHKSPACVSLSTATKLVERGWVQHEVAKMSLWTR